MALHGVLRDEPSTSSEVMAGLHFSIYLRAVEVVDTVEWIAAFHDFGEIQSFSTTPKSSQSVRYRPFLIFVLVRK